MSEREKEIRGFLEGYHSRADIPAALTDLQAIWDLLVMLTDVRQNMGTLFETLHTVEKDRDLNAKQLSIEIAEVIARGGEIEALEGDLKRTIAQRDEAMLQAARWMEELRSAKAELAALETPPPEEEPPA